MPKESFYELYQKFSSIGFNNEASIAYGYLRHLETKGRNIPLCLEKISLVDKFALFFSKKIPQLSEMAKTIEKLYTDKDYRTKRIESYSNLKNNENLNLNNF